MQRPHLTWDLVHRALRKPPRAVVQRVWALASACIQKYRARRLPDSWQIERLLHESSEADVEALWTRLLYAPFLFEDGLSACILEAFPEEAQRVCHLAERAAHLKVEFFGSGLVQLSRPLDWNRDFKSGFTWASHYCHDIAYADLQRNNDVKVPWELSRFQWALPLAQAFALKGDECFAEALVALIEDWRKANPYAWTVNWSCTMDVGLRAMALIWAMRLTRDAKAWTREAKARALETLYGHGHFIRRNIEVSDINGNHYLADAAGLVFCGLFFDGVGESARWATEGRTILEAEIPRQIHPDGVDHEASIPYHRLVLELLLLPLLYLEAKGKPPSEASRESLRRMAIFVADYTGPDGLCPRLGDADDGRGMMLGGQPLDDHRYLCHLVGAWLNDDALLAAAGQSWAEAAWWLGPRALKQTKLKFKTRPSTLYPHGGVLILRNPRFHLVADVGPIGLRGRGGHGHNDATSFELWIDGERIVSDRGAWVYTADAEGRNQFRATASHNLLQVGQEEINRFLEPLNLWQLHDDARPRVTAFEATPGGGIASAEHSGYGRIGLRVSRRWEMKSCTLDIQDQLTGDPVDRPLMLRLWLAEGVTVEKQVDGLNFISPTGRRHALSWQTRTPWHLEVCQRDLSPSYGVRRPCLCLEWSLDAPGTDEAFTLRIGAGPC